VDNSGVQNNGDVWIFEIARPLATRISFDFADESQPIWSPDDKTVVFYSEQRGTPDLYVKKLGSPGPATPLLESEYSKTPFDWSADGRMIVFGVTDQRGGDNADLWFFSVENGTSEAITKTPFSEKEARISPDGKWLAYASDESGRFEMYVQSFPEPGLRQQISSGGGMGPKWRQDGRELFYISPDGRIMAVELAEDPLSQVPAAKPLFKVERRFEDSGDDFDVTSDGQTFVVNTPLTEVTNEPLTLQMNWIAGLQKR
jgi:Tol biopolymer transport system component